MKNEINTIKNEINTIKNEIKDLQKIFDETIPYLYQELKNIKEKIRRIR